MLIVELKQFFLRIVTLKNPFAILKFQNNKNFNHG
jgi:hypothetical protein